MTVVHMSTISSIWRTDTWLGCAMSQQGAAIAHLAVLSQQPAEFRHIAELYDLEDGFYCCAANVELVKLGCHLVQAVHQ